MLTNWRTTTVRFGSSQVAPKEVKSVAHQIGHLQPPKNNVVIKPATVTISANSPSKKHEKFAAGVFDVVTGDKLDSPSGRSKGIRLVSATAAVKRGKNPNGWRKMPQRGANR